ncbi:hypothetical protein C0Q70_20847 [Pomacea canaliculata]|uniref:CAP-Gly domain-containing protein n=1 Tax=Pomacea canaliculata TaxID=400727 RepID=A0A2T7NAV7_POMCA|nr:hypothetical protein C0Q70_20847 [Pomacea canaliculata]
MVLFINVYVGQRVEVYWGHGIFRGTVMYKGCLATKHGDWVGIALDKPLGEHNGMFLGRRYFQCRDGHGIFVRADKIRFISIVRCLYDRYHKVDSKSVAEEPLFATSSKDKNGPRDPIVLTSGDFQRVHSSLGDYTTRSCTLWSKPIQHHRRYSISKHVPAATMLNPGTAMASIRYCSFPVHTQYSIQDCFVNKPSVPKIHMPHSALVKQVQRGWTGAHYVREMSVDTGRDSMKLSQWNDISP